MIENCPNCGAAGTERTYDEYGMELCVSCGETFGLRKMKQEAPAAPLKRGAKGHSKRKPRIPSRWVHKETLLDFLKQCREGRAETRRHDMRKQKQYTFRFNSAEARGRITVSRVPYGLNFEVKGPRGEKYTGFLDLYHLQGDSEDPDGYCFQVVLDGPSDGTACHIRVTPARKFKHFLE